MFECRYHVLFWTKYRRKAITPPINVRVKEISHAEVTKLRGEVIELEVMPDNVHLLLSCNHNSVSI
ncbi:transposase [Brevibacillus aydinogluensis]|uniref:transposase n=1 Tax=Brevibacillus aydinogluensis TaxID=927786 RepID=UPI0034C5CEF6